MTLTDILKKYALNDGSICSFHLNYELKQLTLHLKVRRHLSGQKFEDCILELEFNHLKEIYIFEDFPTDGGYTDITFIKLANAEFYLSLDPYGNSGLPHGEDNLVIKAMNLTVIEPDNVRQEII
jgi:hypothetical protein